MEMKVKFSEELNVESTSPGNYGIFIEGLRNELRNTTSHQLPVLPPENRPPVQWFDIVLRTNALVPETTTTRAIRLRIRRDNLYLDGFQTQNPNGDFDRWFEFGNDGDNQLISDSTFLGFGGGYDAMARAANATVNSITLGQQSLINAVNQLSNPTTSAAMRARSLIIVIEMICESIRFSYISDLLVETFVENSAPRPPRMEALVNAWGALSEELLLYDANPTHRLRELPDVMGIQGYPGVVAVLGILLNRGCARVLMSDNGDCTTKGRALVEVFAVYITNIDNENPGDLYGTILVDDGLFSQYIFNRGSDNYESIRPNEAALLSGPSQCISASDSFTIKLALMDYDYVPWDDEVSNGEISWEAYDTKNVYDDTIYTPISGHYGSATVGYIVLSDAVEAIVEVTLVNGDGESPANVYGTITARNSKFSYESVLYRKASNEASDVYPWNVITLSRNVVALPCDSTLTITADLWDYDVVGYNDHIANGSADFAAQLSGTSDAKPIYGEYGEIRVKITWNN